MHILIVAATQQEISSLQEALQNQKLPHTFHFLVTEVGMMATCFHLTTHLLQYSYDWVLQIGIAGSFDNTFTIGTVVEVVADAYGDLGAEDAQNFIIIQDMQLMQHDHHLFGTNGIWINNPYTYTTLPKATSISVNTCSGNNLTIANRRKHYAPHLETMEGIAFAYVCRQLKIAYTQIRSISNYVTVRDRDSWDIPLALKNLNTFVAQLLQDANPWKMMQPN